MKFNKRNRATIFFLIMVFTVFCFYNIGFVTKIQLQMWRCGCSDQTSKCMACIFQISVTQYCASNLRRYECVPEKKRCCDRLKRTCSTCTYNFDTEMNFCGNKSEEFECYDLPLKCLACKEHKTEDQFCQSRPSLTGCKGGVKGNIMLGISLTDKKGYTKFTASVVTKYHDISPYDIHLFKTISSKMEQSDLRGWYGERIELHTTKDESVETILEYFSKSDYKILFLIDSETIFLQRWKEFISKQLITLDNAFVSLYHSSAMHHYARDCEKYDGDNCEGHISGIFGAAITKKLSQTILRKYRNSLSNFDWNFVLRQEKLKRLCARKSLVIRIGHSNQGQDNCGENEVPYRFNLCEFPSWIKNGIEFYFDRCTSPNEMFLPDISIPFAEETGRLWVRPIISYSLYGSKTRYTDGALENAARVFRTYPGWKIWIYTDGSVPKSVTERLCEYNVHFVDMKQSLIRNKMSWRFLVASAPVKMYAIRDIDGRLLDRGKAAVDEWIKSGRKFHVLRDHPNHSKFPMSGGMWGGLGRSIPDMREKLIQAYGKDVYMFDMYFLNDDIWNIVKKSVWVHDSYSLHKFGEDHPFPTKRSERGEFVGDVNF